MRLLNLIPAAFLTAAGLSGVALATPSTPTCGGVPTIVATNHKVVQGTPGNDVISVGSSNVVYGNGGKDCINLNSSRNVVYTGTSNGSVVVDHVSGGVLIAQGTNDVLVSGQRSVLVGDGSTRCYVNRSTVYSGCATVTQE